jgi:T4-like virus tail tube protein gp19
MARSISDFKSYLKKGGARPNLFMVRLSFPNLSAVADIGGTGSSSSSGLATQTEFLVKTAQIPASNIGTIEVPFRGRMLKVAGDRTFEPWSVTVINDGSFEIRKAFETWSRGINALTENVSQLGYGANGGASYCQDMTVFQLSRDGQTPNKTPSNPNAPGTDGMEIVRAYKFYDAWPSAVSAIDLSYESNDQIEEFTVEFQYNFFEVTNNTF